jgi:2,4-dienoyl-CoA reductase-like NADH-dependent reductase (Old Yellow Enzyme family)/thioredoxin reductase
VIRGSRGGQGENETAMAFTHVDTPIALGPMQLKNRIVRPAHGTNLGKGWISDSLIAYHEARARGGVALSVLEVGSVHPTSPFSINLWDPALEPGYRKLVERIRPHGMKLSQQLWHCGHNFLPADGSPPWSASAIASPEIGVVAIAMTKPMIDEIVEAHATAARRCEDYGLDGVEVQCGHGYLVGQFFSPNTNVRDDEYGGSFENRARFAVEIMQAVRASVSRDIAVGVRVAPDYTPHGLDQNEVLRLARLLEKEGLIDYINLSAGNYHVMPKLIGGMHEPVGYELQTSAPVARALDIPAIVIGRFRTLEEADAVIRAGDGDCVGIVRGLIADPDLVTKGLAGRSDEVRPCIACNQGCINNLLTIGQMECAVNPGAGHELEMGDHLIRPAAEKKTVLVIGGGPAGMEAARVAALRGHRVILAEAGPSLGGALRLAAMAPTRYGMMDFGTWLESEIYRLGVEVRLSTYLDEADVIDIGADAVIVAAGSRPRMDGVQLSHPGDPARGMERANVLSSHDLFLNPPADLGKHAVVIDDAGHWESFAVSEYLASKGLKVTYVTRLHGLSPTLQFTLTIEPFLERMEKQGFAYLIRHRAIAVEDGAVVVGPTHTFDDELGAKRIPADTVVFISGNMPNREIFTSFADRNSEIHVVGDANSPRYLPIAVREGHLAGMKV